MVPGEKPLVWLHGQIKTPPFSQEARIEAGYLLGRLQQGENLSLPAITTDAVDRTTVPRAPRSRQGSKLADCVSHRRRRYCDLRSLCEDDSTDATERRRHVQEKAEALRQLGGAGWKVGTAAEFLGLNKQEAAFVEMKLALARCLHALRIRRKLSQSRVAELVGSSQSRVAKMESGDPSVSIDLLLRSVLAIGGSPAGVVRALASRKKLTPA